MRRTCRIVLRLRGLQRCANGDLLVPTSQCFFLMLCLFGGSVAHYCRRPAAAAAAHLVGWDGHVWVDMVAVAGSGLIRLQC